MTHETTAATGGSNASRSTIHNPVNFDPSQYEIVGYFDNRPPEYIWGMTAECHRMQLEDFRRERDEMFPEHNDHACQHCGQTNVRYVVAAVHAPTGKHVCFGDICVGRLGFPNFEAFQAARIRSNAAARAESYKRGIAREQYLSARPELKAAVEKLMARIAANDEGVSNFGRDLIAKFNQYGNASDAQQKWIIKLADEVFVDKVKEARKAQALISKHVGVVGERSEFTAEIKFSKCVNEDGQFGPVYMTIMEDDAGNVLLYWNTIGSYEKGDKITFKATVKAHSERDGVKQTVLSRAALTKEFKAKEAAMNAVLPNQWTPAIA